MRPVKTIAGDVLLFFYNTQRELGSLPGILEFTDDSYKSKSGIEEDSALTGKKLKDDSVMTAAILRISEGSSNDAYNALQYLHQRRFIAWKASPNNTMEIFHNMSVSAGGIDIVEGIERGDQEKHAFQVTFNINVENNFNIESLLKAELGGFNLFKTF